MYISQLRAGSILMQALEQGLKTNGASIPGESCSRMPAVSMSALPQKIKRNAMYYRNRALRQGNLELLVSDASNCGGMFEALVRLHTDRWRSCGQLGVFADQRVIQWHREAVPQLEQAGILRLCSLLLNGTTIGVLYSLVDPQERAQRTQYFYLPAYSVEHADLRPGTLLTALAVEAAAREGVKTIDMLRGDEEYKRIWHTERFPTCGFFLRKMQARELAA
jgi:CelD/BcsL family acetyltransferase involved in cellulose biosynthesis